METAEEIDDLFLGDAEVWTSQHATQCLQVDYLSING
jgi:hypothetical protein